MNNDLNISKSDVEVVVRRFLNQEVTLHDVEVRPASVHMIGFLCDYWKLKVTIQVEDKYEHVHLFVKSICRSNPAKAAMVEEMNLFTKECIFYENIKINMNIYDLRRWSPELVGVVKDAMVLEDLSHLEYHNRHKLLRFDLTHTLQALHTLANFHAMSIIYEEHKRNANPSYTISDDYEQYLDVGGYAMSNRWLNNCMEGALEAARTFSKHRDNLNSTSVDRNWREIWRSALKLCDKSSVHRNVICHRDLWNNNVLFHYNAAGEPDGCALVDFQGVRLQPPAGDVMMLLYCNLDPAFREANMELFLNYYYERLEDIMSTHKLSLCAALPRERFVSCAREQRRWGVVACACLLPQLYMDDVTTTRMFTDTDRFEQIMTKTKGEFIKQMMRDNEDYKTKVLEIFDEIIERYLL